MVTTSNAVTGANPVQVQAPAVVQSVNVSAPALKKFRIMGNLPYNPGLSSQTQLSVGYKIRGMYLQLVGSAVFSAAYAAGTNGYNLYDMINNVQVQTPGGTTLYNISGKQLFWLNYFRNKVANRNALSSSTVAAPYTSQVFGYLWLPFALNDQLQRVQTSLNATGFTGGGLNLIINWNPLALTFGSTATSATITATVYGDENIGGINPSNLINYSIKNLGSFGANSDFNFLISPASNKAIRAVMLNGYTSAGADQGFTLPKFSWGTGTTFSYIDYDGDLSTLQKLWNSNINTDVITSNDISAFITALRTGGSVPINNGVDLTSIKYIDIAMDGLLTEMYNTAGQAPIEISGQIGTLNNAATSINLVATVIEYLSAA
jgi:hypothetical protein